MIFQNRNTGKPVIEVGDELFCGKKVEEAIIKEGYQYIGRKSFCDNERLHQVVMPSTILEISDHAFEGYHNLKRIHLPDSLEKIVQGAFRDSGLKTIIFPKSL